MEKIIDTEKIPIKLWLNDIEESAMAQIKNLANLPFAFKHIAIMPDSHTGYGMPIGGVLATKGVIIPNAVGVDIGCGMICVKTSLKAEELDTTTLKKIMKNIREKIPVGFNHHNKKQDEKLMPNRATKGYEYMNEDILCDSYKVIWQEYNSALTQIGTLGGGNHFIEIQKGTDNYIYIMIHSGSRNLGYKVAKYYNNVAKYLNEKWYTSVSKEVDLAFLPIDSYEGQAYLKEMNYCLEFAQANRDLMMRFIKDIFVEITGCNFEMPINIHHNYAAMENHFGHNVMIHRKGATSAKKGQLGLIPGSQGTKSYIVRGLGNPESFNSCSHGAGRQMGRKQAQRELNLETEIEKLNAQGILHSIRTVKDLDEASGAYKNIDIVMENQKDLVEIVVELTPLGVIKG